MRADIDKLIVFNHDIPGIRQRVKAYTEAIVGSCTLALPVAGRVQDGVSFHSGSYLWQAAIVEFLRHSAEAGPDPRSLLVLHDDVALNSHQWPAFSSLLKDDLCFGSIYPFQPDDHTSYHWAYRICNSLLASKSVFFGSGVDDAIRLLKDSQIYRENVDHIESLPRSVWRSGDAAGTEPPTLLTEFRKRFFRNESDIELGLPLFIGNSDLLYVPHRLIAAFEDFLTRSLQIGLFVECAIPTFFKWARTPIIDLSSQIDFPFGDAYDRYARFRSESELHAFFETSPFHAVHPVKFSRFS